MPEIVLADGKPVRVILTFMLALFAIAITALPPPARWVRLVVGASSYVSAAGHARPTRMHLMRDAAKPQR